jgi:hypothetical protein
MLLLQMAGVSLDQYTSSVFAIGWFRLAAPTGIVHSLLDSFFETKIAAVSQSSRTVT